ncbi:MAG: hypothetical protein K9H49_09235 [Bacteroidales bacterium]|nr:hypothetical protein [Bacteroidales bacterium]MCF8391565.1 hypothetical protein [Bacteroidales bacterium]
MTEEKNIEFIDEGTENQTKESGILRGIIDGSLLTRKKVLQQFPFVLFLVFLSLMYISNRYHADSVRRKREKLRVEINELRSEAVFVSSELMKISRQTEVAQEVRKKGLELEESIDPPKKIIIKQKKIKE